MDTQNQRKRSFDNWEKTRRSRVEFCLSSIRCDWRCNLSHSNEWMISTRSTLFLLPQSRLKLRCVSDVDVDDFCEMRMPNESEIRKGMCLTYPNDRSDQCLISAGVADAASAIEVLFLLTIHGAYDENKSRLTTDFYDQPDR